MRSAGARVLVACAAVAVTALLAPGAATAVPAADPAGQPSDGPAAVSTLRSVTPNVLTPADDGLTVKGTVHNTGDVTLHNVQALPRFSRVSLDSRSDVRSVSTDENLNWGSRSGDVYDLVDESLDPGEVRDFTLEVPTDLFEFDQAGVYPVGVDVMASPADGAERLRVSTSRTVVPWLSSTDDLPTVPVGVLWPLSARPTMMPEGTLLDDSLAAQLGEDEPLSAIVEAGADSPVTWAVDPDLLDTVGVMADGYRVAAPGGPVDGSQADSEAAQEWRQAFSQATAESDVWVLPYAMPDVGSLAVSAPQLAADLSQQSLAAADATARSIGGATPGIAWLDGGSVTDEVLTTLAEAGADTVIVPGSAVSSSHQQALGEFDVGDAALQVVATDVGLGDALGDASEADDPQAGAADLRQRWIAETAMVAMAAAADNTEPALMVAAPPVRWRPDSSVAQSVIDTWTSIPWVDAVDLAELEEIGQRQEFTPEPVEGTNLLPETNVTAVGELHDDAAQYTTLLADSESVTGGLTLATLRAASTGWRDDPAAGAAYATTITDDLTARFDEISVTVPESVTLSSRTGSFPLTVTNNLPDAVNVKLDIHSTNIDRLRIEDVDPALVQPGERLQVTVTAQAAANGRVPIDVRLTTADGTPIGPSRPTVVNATDYGTIGWIIVGGAGALFAVAIVRRSLRKGKGSDDDLADDLPDDDHPGGTLPPEPAPAQEVTQ